MVQIGAYVGRERVTLTMVNIVVQTNVAREFFVLLLPNHRRDLHHDFTSTKFILDQLLVADLGFWTLMIQ